jgi:hypothetical protein
MNYVDHNSVQVKCMKGFDRKFSTLDWCIKVEGENEEFLFYKKKINLIMCLAYFFILLHLFPMSFWGSPKEFSQGMRELLIYI